MKYKDIFLIINNMSQKILYNKELVYSERIKNNSFKIDFYKENKSIYGKSFFKNDTIYLNNTDKTIFYFMKTNDKS